MISTSGLYSGLIYGTFPLNDLKTFFVWFTVARSGPMTFGGCPLSRLSHSGLSLRSFKVSISHMVVCSDICELSSITLYYKNEALPLNGEMKSGLYVSEEYIRIHYTYCSIVKSYWNRLLSKAGEKYMLKP